MPKLKANQSTGSASHNGNEYIPDDKGFIDVPENAVADLLSHGFRQVNEADLAIESPKKGKNKD